MIARLQGLRAGPAVHERGHHEALGVNALTYTAGVSRPKASSSSRLPRAVPHRCRLRDLAATYAFSSHEDDFPASVAIA